MYIHVLEYISYLPDTATGTGQDIFCCMNVQNFEEKTVDRVDHIFSKNSI
jgi:hypothetical protein